MLSGGTNSPVAVLQGGKTEKTHRVTRSPGKPKLAKLQQTAVIRQPSQQARHWKDILVSDDYGVYRKWLNHRQSCLANYIRRALALRKSKDESLQDFGKSILKELQLPCH